MHLIGLIVLGRRIAVTLPGDRVHDHRTVEAASKSERVLHCRDVVSVHRPDVLQPEVFEHALRRQHVLHPAFHAVQRLVEGRAHDGDPRQVVLHTAEHALVSRAQPELGQVLGERADRRRVGTAVVVHHDDDRQLGDGDVVQCLPAHAAGERTVTDDGDDRTMFAADRECLREPIGVREGRRCMRILDPVMRALRAIRVTGNATRLPQGGHPLRAPGQDLVHVGLMTDVPEQGLRRRIENPVQGDGELDRPKIRTKVSPGAGNRLDEDVADLLRQHHQLIGRQRPQVPRRTNAIQHTSHAPSLRGLSGGSQDGYALDVVRHRESVEGP